MIIEVTDYKEKDRKHCIPVDDISEIHTCGYFGVAAFTQIRTHDNCVFSVKENVRDIFEQIHDEGYSNGYNYGHAAGFQDGYTTGINLV